MMKKIILLNLMFLLLIPDNIYAYGDKYIIIDKDGYTNVREEPNSKSKIVGKIYKYQVFYSTEICGEEATDKWLPITSDSVSRGYIYKKNILPLKNLPVIHEDSACIRMETQPFDKNHYKIKRVQDGTDDNGNDRFLYFMQTVDGNDCYGTDGWLPHIEIMKVEIDYKEKTIVLPQNIIKKYFDPHGISVYIGLDNELYIRISGGDGVAWYAAWFSVVKGKVVFESVEELCI